MEKAEEGEREETANRVNTFVHGCNSANLQNLMTI